MQPWKSFNEYPDVCYSILSYNLAPLSYFVCDAESQGDAATAPHSKLYVCLEDTNLASEEMFSANGPH